MRDRKLADQQIPWLQTVHFSADPLVNGTSIRSNTFGQSTDQGGSNKLFQQRLPKPRSIRSAIRFRQREEKKEENRHARYQSRKRQEDNHKTIIPLQWPHVITVEKNFVFIETAGTDQLQKCK